MRTKQTAHGSKSQHPKGMATLTFPSSTEADPEQQGASRDTEDSQDWPDILQEAMQGGTGTSKVQVRQVTNPSRLKEEHWLPPRKSHQQQNPVTRNQVLARTPPMSHPRPPPRT